MMEPIRLKLVPEPRPWVRLLHLLSLGALLAFVGSAIMGRVVLERSTDSSLISQLPTVLWLTGSIGIGGLGLPVVVRALGGQHFVEVAPPAAEIELREDALLLGEQLIPLTRLNGILLESNGYRGGPGGRTPQSGAGKLQIKYTAAAADVGFRVVVESAQQLEQLRQLAGVWRSRGVTAFIMD